MLMLSTVFSVPLTTTASAQPVEEWVARHRGSGGDYQGHGIVLGSSGNVYVSGDGRWKGYNTGRDYLTIGYDSSGNELWVARYDGPDSDDDKAHDMVTDSSENIYVIGHSGGSGTSADYATIAYDSSGNELWVARYDGPASLEDWGTDIALDASDNVYVTGRSHDAFEVWDFATVAYDSSGNELWVARYDGPSGWKDIARDIAVGPFGNVYVTGATNWNEDDEDWDSDWATIAYDTSGKELWVATYDGPASGFDEPWAMAIDFLGNVYVTGSSEGNETKKDFTTVAYDSTGNELWVASYDGGPESSEDIAVDMALDSLGNVYVTGVSWRGVTDRWATVAYDSSGNELWVARDACRRRYDIETGPSGNIYVTGVSSGVIGEMDYSTVAYDPSGNELWVMSYDGEFNGPDISEGIAVDHFGNVYVTGTSQYNIGRNEVVTIKYAPGQTPEPTVDIAPDTLNLRSRGRWITAYLELSGGKSVADIDVSSLLLNETIPAENWPTAIGDHDEDGIPDLMIKFNRSRVQEYIEGLNLSPGGAGIFGYYVTLTVTGSFNDGTTFECSDTIRVLTVERMGVEPSPFSGAEYDGSTNGGLVADQPRISFPLSSHSSERPVIVVSDMDYCELPTRRTKLDVLIVRQ